MFEPFVNAAWGAGGGLATELVQWFGLRFTLHRQLPDWSKSWLYWAITFGMALMGGVLVYGYAISGTPLSPILALNVGASAPLLLGKLAQQAPTIPVGTSN